MQYFCLLDRESQQQFKFYWQPGQENLGDYPSKHHPAEIHQHVRPYYVHMDTSCTLLPRAMKPSTRGGCAEILGDPYFKKSPLPSIGKFPSVCHPKYYRLPITWPTMTSAVTHYIQQPLWNSSSVAHNSRERYLAVSHLRVS
jgi:hypothetical protein